MNDIKFKTKKRITIIVISLFLLFILLFFRVAYIQLVDAGRLQILAEEQQTRDELIPAKRGDITDRNGTSLAVSATVDQIVASPKDIAKGFSSNKLTLESVAQSLSTILDIPYDKVYSKISRNSSYEVIARRVELTISQNVRKYIESSKVTGITLNPDTKRYYPQGNFASQVIGFTGEDNQGLQGIENMQDSILKGSSGKIVSAKDSRGVELPFDSKQYVEAQSGNNVKLTIDSTIQHIAEKHLDQAMFDNKVENGGVIIVMDVKTGEILALANSPTFNLNSPFSLNNEEKKVELEKLSGDDYLKKLNENLQSMWRNKAISDTYEPGSTFKVVTASMGLEEKVVSLTDRFFDPGYTIVDGVRIKCWKAGGHGAESFLEGIKNSCNPVFIEVGSRVGAEKFMNYYKGFGLTQKTGIDLSGEANGLFYSSSTFRTIELATASFGQGPTVTPIQMITALSASVNGGILMKPHIVKKITDSDGNVIKEIQPTEIRRVISKETSSTIAESLEKVVSEGTGQNAYVKGFRIAGKTGTSEKHPRGNGKYVASFGGFAPANSPKIAVLVILDEPSAGQHFGGVIAAPVGGRVFDDVLHYINIQPQYTAEELAILETVVPDIRKLDLKAAKDALDTAKLKYRIVGNGETVFDQVPKFGVSVNANAIVNLYTQENTTIRTVSVPNLNGLTVNQAKNTLTSLGLQIKVIGAASLPNATGNIVAYTQDIAEGTSVQEGTVITVGFRNLDEQVD